MSCPLAFSSHSCRHCPRARCLEVCEQGVITRDEVTKRITLNQDLCNGCFKCIKVCPFGALHQSNASKREQGTSIHS
ncbi:MAG: 4Fe-4S dicluster domain-containing protein [Anaerotardibacter sp.]